MKRKIIEINEELCNGCGLCIPNCAEGALQLIDDKARLISDLFCDGLGACIGHCPEGAIEIIEREAQPYDEVKTMALNIVPAGVNTIKAHLEHLKDHGETEYYNQAIKYLKENNMPNPLEIANLGGTMHQQKGPAGGGCPGSKAMSFKAQETLNTDLETGERPSQLRQWPVQLHLLSPQAGYLKGSDLLLAADCTAFALGDFHKDYLKNKSLAIACPKLDSNQQIYLEKLISMIDDSNINTITVMVMEVPCCGGLLMLARKAVETANRKIPVKKIVVGVQGNILEEDWL
jgi:NAD-dependent dihydropyrimidine dehydrogenase PreA subunit